MRKLRIDVPQFLADYHDAVSGMSVREFCDITGLHIATLHGRIETLAKRGVVLPLLKGMRRRSKMGRRLMGLPPKPVVVEAVKVEPVPPVEPAPLPPLSFTVCVGSGF